MDGGWVGRRVRALRHRRGWRQIDLAARSGESQDVVSRVERGRIDDMPVRRVAAIARALDAELVISLRWRGGELDRLLDEGHAALLGRVAELLRASGWVTEAEVSYSVYGERGSIDLLAWHEPSRTLLVIEVKTELVSVEATLRKHDEKARLAARIAVERLGWRAASTARLLVLPDLSTARRHVERHGAVLGSAYSVRGDSLRGWLRDPMRPGKGRAPVSGLLFVSLARPMHGRSRPITRKRIRRRDSSVADRGRKPECRAGGS
jgi:transcriptional regulator with XRE-family HTH domain